MKMGQDRTEKTHLVWTCKARSVSSISLTKRTNHKVCVKARKESIISRTVALKNKILYVFMIMSILCVTLLQSFDSSGSELVEKTTFEIKSKTIICYDSHPVSGSTSSAKRSPQHAPWVWWTHEQTSAPKTKHPSSIIVIPLITLAIKHYCIALHCF